MRRAKCTYTPRLSSNRPSSLFAVCRQTSDCAWHVFPHQNLSASREVPSLGPVIRQSGGSFTLFLTGKQHTNTFRRWASQSFFSADLPPSCARRCLPLFTYLLLPLLIARFLFLRHAHHTRFSLLVVSLLYIARLAVVFTGTSTQATTGLLRGSLLASSKTFGANARQRDSHRCNVGHISQGTSGVEVNNNLGQAHGVLDQSTGVAKFVVKYANAARFGAPVVSTQWVGL